MSRGREKGQNAERVEEKPEKAVILGGRKNRRESTSACATRTSMEREERMRGDTPGPLTHGERGNRDYYLQMKRDYKEGEVLTRSTEKEDRKRCHARNGTRYKEKGEKTDRERENREESKSD